MPHIIVSFLYQGKVYLIDEFGQIWSQVYLLAERRIELTKIGEIDLRTEPEEVPHG